MTEGHSHSVPRFCRQCGGEVPPGAAVCPECGQKWYMDRTEQQGVELWQKIIEKRAAAGLTESDAEQDQKQYHCPHCMADLKEPFPVCPYCGESTIKARIVPSAAEEEKPLAGEPEPFDLPDEAKGLSTIRGAGQRSVKLKKRKRFALDTLIIIAIIVILAGIAFLLARQFGWIPANLFSSSTSSTTPASQQSAVPTQTSPTISNISVSNITSSVATIEWSTDTPAWGKVLYGKTKSYDGTALAELQMNSQKVNVTGLEPGTEYYFVITATDAKGLELSRSEAGVFKTIAQPDTAPPSITQIEVTPMDISVEIRWATDEPSTSQVLYGTTTSVSNSSQLESNLTTDHYIRITGLDANTRYYYSVKSVDIAGNVGNINPPDTFVTLAAVPLGSKVGSRASDFTLPVFKSQDTVTLRSFKGQKVLLTFCAFHLPEFDRELAILQSIQNRNIPGVNIITVFLESRPDDIERVLSAYRASNGDLTVPVVVDMYKTAARLYNIEKLPRTFFIDGDMIIRHIENGNLNVDQAEQILKDL